MFNELDIPCLQAGLDLWVHVSLRTSAAISTVQYDFVLDIWKHLSAMAEGKRGSTLCAASLPVLSIIVRDQLLAGNLNNG